MFNTLLRVDNQRLFYFSFDNDDYVRVDAAGVVYGVR